MNRIAIKFAALLLLSTGYVMASTTASRTNILKDATKTNVFCPCRAAGGQTLFAECSTGTCVACCATVGATAE